MGQREILLAIAKLLSRHKVAYLLTGSLAVSYYGYPRATHDIEFVIEVRLDNFQTITKVVRELGKDYLFDSKNIKPPQFNIYHLSTGIKIDFWTLGTDDFEQSKFKRRRGRVISGQK